MDLDIDEDFQIMDDVFSIEKDEEMTLVLEEETYVALKITQWEKNYFQYQNQYL